jgi:hypothetical protein
MTVQLAMFRGHPVGDSREGGGRFRWTARFHVARRDHYDRIAVGPRIIPRRFQVRCRPERSG